MYPAYYRDGDGQKTTETATPTAAQVVVDRISRATATIARLEAERLADLAELDRLGVGDETDGLTAPAWLAHIGVLPKGDVAWRTRTAGRLGELPELFDALVLGRVNFCHAREISEACFHKKVGDQVREMLPVILELAEGTTDFESFKRDLASLMAQLETDGGHDRDAQPDANRATSSRFGDTLSMKLQVTGLTRELFEEHLAVMVDRMMEQIRADQDSGIETEMPSLAMLRFLAIQEALGIAVDGAKDPEGPNGHVTVIVDSEDGTIRSPRTGNQLSQAFLDFIGHNAYWQALRVDSDGNPLYMGMKVRYANADQRRALFARDGGCCIAGCRNRGTHLIAHHVQYWDNNGPTNIDNLLLVCRQHHRRIHQERWEAIQVGPQHWIFRTRTGRLIHTQRHGKVRRPPNRPDTT